MLNKKDFIVFNEIEFNKILNYEYERTDYSGTNFSLVIFNRDIKNVRKQTQKRLFNLLCKRARTLDIVGFFDEIYLCVLLPSTPYDEAEKYVSNLNESFKKYQSIFNSIEVYSYPDKWLKRTERDIQSIFKSEQDVYAGKHQ